MQQAGGQEGLVLARADLGAHQLRAGGQDAGVLLVEVDAGHGGHVVDVVVIPGGRAQGSEVREMDWTDGWINTSESLRNIYKHNVM